MSERIPVGGKKNGEERITILACLLLLADDVELLAEMQQMLSVNLSDEEYELVEEKHLRLLQK